MSHAQAVNSALMKSRDGAVESRRAPGGGVSIYGLQKFPITLTKVQLDYIYNNYQEISSKFNDPIPPRKEYVVRAK